jgi:hypothetical protein
MQYDFVFHENLSAKRAAGDYAWDIEMQKNIGSWPAFAFRL